MSSCNALQSLQHKAFIVIVYMVHYSAAINALWWQQSIQLLEVIEENVFEINNVNVK